MQCSIAFYKGPPSSLWRKVGHYAIRLWTWSRWSHAELVIDGVCYSSSMRDGGVRRKRIDLDSGRWDVVPIAITADQEARALEWFVLHEGRGYDYRNIGRWVIPFIPQHPAQFVCFESIGEMLGMAGAYRLDADDLFEWANSRRQELTELKNQASNA